MTIPLARCSRCGMTSESASHWSEKLSMCSFHCPPNGRYRGHFDGVLCRDCRTELWDAFVVAFGSQLFSSWFLKRYGDIAPAPLEDTTEANEGIFSPE